MIIVLKLTENRNIKYRKCSEKIPRDFDLNSQRIWQHYPAALITGEINTFQKLMSQSKDGTDNRNAKNSRIILNNIKHWLECISNRTNKYKKGTINCWIRFDNLKKNNQFCNNK